MSLTRNFQRHCFLDCGMHKTTKMLIEIGIMRLITWDSDGRLRNLHFLKIKQF